MGELLPIVVVILVAAGGLVLAQRSLERWEMGAAQLAFLAHILAAFAQVWITAEIYGSGDMTGYWHQGAAVAGALRYQFESVFPEVVKLIFQSEDVRLPFLVYGIGSATGSMAGISALLLFLLGDSLHAVCIAVASTAFFGKLLLYRAISSSVTPDLRRRIFVATMLVPSLVFWSSALLKESVAIGPLGLMVFGLVRLRVFTPARLVTSVTLILLGAVPVALVKAYLLFPFAIAAGVWIYWTRAARRGGSVSIRPAYLVVGAVVAIGGIVALGQVFPEYALDRVGEETARQQEAGQTVEGGSNYSMGDPAQRSLAGQLAFAPWAITTALLRPFIFEVRNVLMLVSALETTVLLALLFVALFGRQWSVTKARISSSPILMFCLVFSLTLALAVGLATTNMGTLSRYRMPLMPFFVAVLAVVSHKSGASAGVSSAGPSNRPARAAP